MPLRSYQPTGINIMADLLAHSNRHFDLVVVGELNADLILNGDVVPVFGQVEKIVDDAHLVIGSSAAIVACGAAKLGLRVAIVGKIGGDELGRFLVRELESRQINVESIVIDPHVKTGLSVILSRGNDRAILTYLGAISTLRYEEIALAVIERARHLHLCSYYLLDALRPNIPALFDFAHSRSLSTSLDTNFDPTGQWDGGIGETLERTDIFLPNETELVGITRQGNIQDALTQLAETVPTVAVKLGSRGGIAQRTAEFARNEILPVNVVDTVGAGDSFNAGFIYGHLQGWGLAQALRFACVCGSLSTRAAGGTSAQPSLEEALSWIRVI